MAGLCHAPYKKGQDALRVFLRLRFAAPPEHPECVSQAEPLLQTDCCTTQLTWDGGGTIDATVVALAVAFPALTAPPGTPAPKPQPTPTPTTTPTPAPAPDKPSEAAAPFREGAEYYRQQYNQLGQPWLAESYYYYYAGIAKFIELAESGRYEEGVANYHFYQSFAQFCFYGHYGYYASAWYYFYNAQALGYYHWYVSQGDLSLANWYYNDFVRIAQNHYQTLTAMGFR